MKPKLLLLALCFSLCGCADIERAISPQVQTWDEMHPHSEFINGAHYKVETVFKNGHTYEFYRTYIDYEDGGNTMGWIQKDGKKIAQIFDGDIYPLDWRPK